MSASGVFSCISCHNLATCGDDNMETAIGRAWQRGPRNSPTVLNAAFNEAQFGGGRADDLAEQGKGKVQAGVEMAKAPENLISTLITTAPFDAWLNGDDRRWRCFVERPLQAKAIPPASQAPTR